MDPVICFTWNTSLIHYRNTWKNTQNSSPNPSSSLSLKDYPHFIETLINSLALTMCCVPDTPNLSTLLYS